MHNGLQPCERCGNSSGISRVILANHKQQKTQHCILAVKVLAGLTCVMILLLLHPLSHKPQEIVALQSFPTLVAATFIPLVETTQAGYYRPHTSNRHRSCHPLSRHQEHPRPLSPDGQLESDSSQLQDLETYMGIAIPSNVTKWILGLSYLMRELLYNPQEGLRLLRTLHHQVVSLAVRLLTLGMLGHYTTKILS